MFRHRTWDPMISNSILGLTVHRKRSGRRVVLAPRTSEEHIKGYMPLWPSPPNKNRYMYDMKCCTEVLHVIIIAVNFIIIIIIYTIDVIKLS